MLCTYGAVSTTYFVGKEQKRWVYTIFRQKNIRTKVMTLNVRMYVQASLTNIVHSMLSICDAGSVYPTFVERTEGSECLRFLKTEEHKNKSFI